MAGKIETHHDLRVYQKAFQAAMQVFVLTKAFPRRDILPERSDSPVIALCLRESG